MIDRTDGVTTDIDIRIVCQIASGIGLLNIFPNSDSARSFLLPLLATVPGCGAVHIYLRGDGSPAAMGPWINAAYVHTSIRTSIRAVLRN